MTDAEWLLANADKALAVLRAARELRHEVSSMCERLDVLCDWEAEALHDYDAAVASLGPVPGTEEG